MVALRQREKVDAKSLGEFDEAVPQMLRQVYAARQLSSSADLDVSLQSLQPPHTLLHLDVATALLVDAHAKQHSLLIVADFDADGATSCALCMRALTAMGFERLDFLVPNRFDYGYGLTPEIVDVAAKARPDIIITVDNGISSVAGVQRAAELGIEVLVTDHHLPGETLPAARAIVNPNQPGCEFPSKALAGVGVAFYLLLALNKALLKAGCIPASVNMAQWLDIVALGTVADVVPLDKNNRILVEQGLRRIRSGSTVPGILALLQVAGRDHDRLVASDLGFTVGPRINAAGRLDDMSLGIQCLLSDDAQEARLIAGELHELNQSRRSIEAGMQREAEAMLAAVIADEKRGAAELPRGICIYDDTWHQGVIGILASRIKERLHRPVIAFAPVSDTLSGAGGNADIEIKGSARSIPGIHIRDVLDLVAKRHPELLQKFGGHAMAAGLSLELRHYEQFAVAFDNAIRDSVDANVFVEELLTDGAVGADELTLGNAQLLRYAGPWGQGFPEPLFEGEFQLLKQRIVGERHLKLQLSPIAETGQRIDAIAFNVDTDIWPNAAAQRVHAVYRMDVNRYRGNDSLQLVIEHIDAR